MFHIKRVPTFDIIDHELGKRVGYITIDNDYNHKEEEKPCFFPYSKGTSKVKRGKEIQEA